MNFFQYFFFNHMFCVLKRNLPAHVFLGVISCLPRIYNHNYLLYLTLPMYLDWEKLKNALF